MAYEEEQKNVGASDKPKFKTSAQVVAENGTDADRVRRRLDSQPKPHLAPGELSALWAKEKKSGK